MIAEKNIEIMSQRKVIVITGITAGIGCALVEWFLKHGHTVIGCGRSVSKITEMMKKFQSKKCSLDVVDVSEPEEVKNWAQTVCKLYGAPDLLLNNAAIANKPNNLWEVPLEEFDEVIDINLKGVNYVIHYFLPYMLKAMQGIIVNFSSGWGRSTASNTAPYCATKWGVEGLSMALAQELPEPLACMPMNPGIIYTEMLENFFGESAKYYRTPKKWAETAGPFLLSLNRENNGERLTAP